MSDEDASAAKPARRGERRRKATMAVKKVKAGSDVVRARIASLVWLVAVVAAVILAVGALLVALHANQGNTLVSWVLDVAGKIDGPFWKIFEFTKNGHPDVVKEHLVNWGLAAVAYLIVGRILDRIIRP
ncbi:MAG: hypothetical protein ACRDPG_07500 [Nocardioidaceae bacterium]